MTRFAVFYANQSAPALGEQTSFLQVVQGLRSSVHEARVLWRPTFAVWSAWCAVAGILSIVAFIAVNRVTKARLDFARKQYARDFDTSNQQNTVDIFQEKPHNAKAPLGSRALYEARSDYITLSLQFGLAAVLLLICEVMLLWNSIVGYDIHVKPDLLATAVLVPPIAYFLHSSTSLGFIIVSAGI